MANYYFHTHYGTEVFRDTEGLDLADEATAWSEATRACGEMIAGLDGALHIGCEWVMEVEDDAGPLFRLRFGAESVR